MTAQQRVLGSAVLALLFTRALGQPLENHVRLGCVRDDHMPLCGVDVNAWVPQWHDPFAATPLMVWALAAAGVTAVLVAIWNRAPLRSHPPTAGVALCSFGLVLLAIVDLVNHVVLMGMLRARLQGEAVDDLNGLSLHFPFMISLVTGLLTLAAGFGLWAMRPWARALGAVLAAAMALLTLWGIVRFQLVLAAYGADQAVPLLVSSVLLLAQWALIAGYLLLPSVGRQFPRER